MKKNFCLVAGLVVSLNLLSLQAQPGAPGRGDPDAGGPGGPMISEAMTKLFGANTVFTAHMDTQMKMASQSEPITIPAKVTYDSGKSRFEMNMLEWKGIPMRPGAAEQIKAMGIDSMVVLSRLDSPLFYTLFPNMKAYLETPVPSSNTNQSSNSKLETTVQGKETVDGHECVKKKVVVTDDKGKPHEFMVWSATDLKDFPVKIETTDSGSLVVMSFKDVKFNKPDASQFEPPSDYTKYTSQLDLMQKEMMKRLPQGGAGGMPVGQ